MNLDDVFAHIDAEFPRYLAGIQGYLRQRGVSVTNDGMDEAAEYTANLIREVGGEAELVPTGGNPVVYGRLDSKRPSAKTLIASSLYDVVPADPAQWVSDPFAADILDSNEVRQVGWDICRGPTLVGRGARNQRAPNLAFLYALDAMRQVTGDIPVNVIFTFDGEEELSSPNWTTFLEAKRDELLTADAAFQHGFRQDEQGRHVIQLGFKGISMFELVVEGGEWGGTLDGSDLGPGDAVWVEAPVLVLMKAVRSLIDDDGRCTIDGFWDSVASPTPIEKRLFAALMEQFDEEAARKARNVARFRGHKSAAELYADWCSAPILNVDGVVAGYTSDQFTTVLPMKATAKMDVRLVPDQSLDEFYAKLRAHLDARGLTMVQIRRQGGVEPGKSDPDDPFVDAALEATRRFGLESQVWPISSAGNPLAFYAREPFNLPIMFAGLGYSAKAHQPNEWADVDGIRRSMRWLVEFLAVWAGDR